MHICDITREDEVVGKVAITAVLDGDETATPVTYEVGKRAFDAFNAGAWGALQTLTPPNHRVKDAKKAAAGKKAAASRQANAAAKASTPAAEAPVPPSDKGAANAAPTPPENATAAPAGSDANDSGDPGF